MNRSPHVSALIQSAYAKPTPLWRDFAPLAVAVLLAAGGAAVLASGCGSPSPAEPATAIDVSTYTAKQLACVEREDTADCQRDKPACRARIDACRATVKKEYGR